MGQLADHLHQQMSLIFVVFVCFISSLVNAASDEFSYNITSGKVTVTCAFKFVYKLGGSKIDLRRSTADCEDLPRAIKVKDYAVSSECGSVFTISMTASKKKASITSGTVTPSAGCKPSAPPPTTTMKPKPKRKCPYGTTLVCPSFEDGSCLPKQVSICFKEGKMGKEPTMGEMTTGEMPIEMTTGEMTTGETPTGMTTGGTPVELTTPASNSIEEVEEYKPSKEERDDVIAACMCMPNIALYMGALKLTAPEKKPGKGKQPEQTTEGASETTEAAAKRELEIEGRAACSEKFTRNFKVGKLLVKCSWVLIYTDQKLDLAKSKASCTKTNKAAIKAKDIAIKTDCGSVITMNVNVAKKTEITKGTVTSVGSSCKCYVEATTAAQTAGTTEENTEGTAEGTTEGTAEGTTGGTPGGTTPGGKGPTSGGKGKGSTPGGTATTPGETGTTFGGKGTTSGGGKGKGTTSGGGQGIGGGQGNGGGFSPQENVFSPRFMNECACIEQGAIKKGKA